MAPAFNVLFLCTHNSARSIMAEAMLEQDRQGPVQRLFGRLRSGRAPMPEVLDRLQQLGHDVSRTALQVVGRVHRPDAPRMDFVIALCDTPQGQDCPDFGETVRDRRLAIAGPGQSSRGIADRARHAAQRALRHGPAPHRDLHEPAVRLARSHGDEGAPRRDRRQRRAPAP